MGIIIKPLVTEKMTAITEKSSVDKTYKAKQGAHRGEQVTIAAQPKYGFIVAPDANKRQIKEEVEALYNVTVLAVNTCIYAGKNKNRYTRSGLIKGRTNRFKKAVVTIANGQSIDFYSNID